MVSQHLIYGPRGLGVEVLGLGNPGSILEDYLKALEDRVVARYYDCIGRIIISDVTWAFHKKCLEALKKTELLYDILALKEVNDGEAREKLLKHFEEAPGSYLDKIKEVEECWRLLERFRKASKTCLEYAKQPLKCLELEASPKTSPDKVEACWEIVDKTHPPIILI